MSNGRHYCLNLNLSMYFSLGSGSPVTFKIKLYVTKVNKSLKTSIFCHKELHLRGPIRPDLNILRCPTKFLKHIGGTPLRSYDRLQPWENMNNSSLRCCKIQFERFFALTFFAFNIKWTKWSWYQLIDINCGFILCSVFSKDI